MTLRDIAFFILFFLLMPLWMPGLWLWDRTHKVREWLGFGLLVPLAILPAPARPIEVHDRVIVRLDDNCWSGVAVVSEIFGDQVCVETEECGLVVGKWHVKRLGR